MDLDLWQGVDRHKNHAHSGHASRLSAFETARWRSADPIMQLFVQLLFSGRKVTVEAEGEHTVAQLKDMIFDKDTDGCAHPGLQRLILGSAELHDE